jgi:FkbM family methyltransferase
VDADLVFDVGANNGDDSVHYLSRGFRVVAVEANPELCRRLHARCAADVEAGRLAVEAVGIAERRGTETLWVDPAHSQFGSFDERPAGRAGRAAPVQVECITAADLFAKHGVPYYLKVDVEGRERLLLDALDPGDLPAYVSTEARGLEDLDSLWAKGYRRFRLVDQTAHNGGPRSPHWLRALRRRLGPPGAFPPGSSGPVPDSYGSWEDRETVASRWLRHRDGRAWFDFHASAGP